MFRNCNLFFQRQYFLPFNSDLIAHKQKEFLSPLCWIFVEYTLPRFMGTSIGIQYCMGIQIEPGFCSSRPFVKFCNHFEFVKIQRFHEIKT